jgi:predicted DNA-binding transcriptional regulator YafY
LEVELLAYIDTGYARQVEESDLDSLDLDSQLTLAIADSEQLGHARMVEAAEEEEYQLAAAIAASLHQDQGLRIDAEESVLSHHPLAGTSAAHAMRRRMLGQARRQRRQRDANLPQAKYGDMAAWLARMLASPC